MSDRHGPEVLAWFRNPRNAGRLPLDAPGVRTGEAGDEDMGELVRIQLRVDPTGRILDARFQAFGCPATIACASFAAAHAEGEPTAAEIARALRLPAGRLRLAELAARALREALDA